jgi:proline iminopeptidase
MPVVRGLLSGEQWAIVTGPAFDTAASFGDRLMVAAHDGTTLHVGVHGDGPPVLLLAGGPGLVHYLDDPRTAPTGFRVLCPEPRGIGRSGGGPHDLAQAIDDLEAIREWAGVPCWRVVGHSWGADLGLAYATECPGSVQGLVSIAGTGIQNDRGWHEAYTRLLGTEPMPDIAGVPEVHRALIDHWRRWIADANLLARLRDLPVPVSFVLCGDDIRPGWPIEHLAALLPHASLRRLAGAPHNLWHTEPDRWRRVVAEELAAVANVRVRVAGEPDHAGHADRGGLRG